MTEKARKLIQKRGLKKKPLNTQDKEVRHTLCNIINSTNNAVVKQNAGIDVNWRRVAEEQKNQAECMLAMITSGMEPVFVVAKDAPLKIHLMGKKKRLLS